MNGGLLTFASGIFVWRGDFSTKDAPKAAGFRWHGGGCKAGCPACAAGVGKAWWTGDVDKASALVEHADAAARERMAGAVRDVEASAAADADIEVPTPEGLSLLPFQRAAVAYAMGRKRTLLADEMGLGKSPESLVFVNTVTEIRSVLVICPASLTLNWLYEARRWLVPGARPAWTFHVVEPGIRPPPDADFVIVADSRVAGRGSVGAASVLAALLERRWGCLIVDEAHRFKSEDAARSQAVMGVEARSRKGIEGLPGLVDRADRVLMLTGTPLINRPAEMWNLLRTLDPVVWASRWPFYRRYCDAHKEKIGHGKNARYVWNIAGASNLEELQRKLRTVMCRRMKSEVLQELPEKRRQIILLPADGLLEEIEEERRLWSGYEGELADLEAECEAAAISGDEKTYAEAALKLTVRQRVAFTELSRARHRLAVAKIPLCTEHILSALESGSRPLVVFAHHRDVVEGIRDSILEAGHSCAEIVGDTPVEVRQFAVESFQAGQLDVLIGSIGAMGVGFTLTASSTVVFCEISYVPADLSQAEDREHRIGQHSPVLVQHLVVDGSLDARMAHVVVMKQEWADRALNADRLKTPVVPTAERSDALDGSPRKWPEATAERRVAAGRVVRALAGICDGAAAKDGCGYARADARLGRILAERSAARPLTDGEVWVAARWAAKYKEQLIGMGLEDDVRILGGLGKEG